MKLMVCIIPRTSKIFFEKVLKFIDELVIGLKSQSCQYFARVTVQLLRDQLEPFLFIFFWTLNMILSVKLVSCASELQWSQSLAIFDIKSMFKYRLFYWNWKLITENTVNKNKN